MCSVPALLVRFQLHKQNTRNTRNTLLLSISFSPLDVLRHNRRDTVYPSWATRRNANDQLMYSTAICGYIRDAGHSMVEAILMQGAFSYS